MTYTLNYLVLDMPPKIILLEKCFFLPRLVCTTRKDVFYAGPFMALMYKVQISLCGYFKTFILKVRE